METQQQINELQSRQLELRAIMASSDERAAKCFKNGTSFRETYPDDFARYEAANAAYNRDAGQTRSDARCGTSRGRAGA